MVYMIFLLSGTLNPKESADLSTAFDFGGIIGEYSLIAYRQLFNLRPVPTRPIFRRLTAIVGRFPSVDSRALRILK